jgi:ML domain
MFKFLVLLAFVPAILARTPVRQCNGGLPLPNAVWFDGRTNPCLAAPCSVSRSSGRGVTYVDFTTRNAASSIMPRVRARVFGVTITQELPVEIQRNPCSILESPHTCPLAANQSASYRLELPVESSTPLVSSDTEITLFGDNNEVIFCYQLQTRVVV